MTSIASRRQRGSGALQRGGAGESAEMAWTWRVGGAYATASAYRRLAEKTGWHALALGGEYSNK